MVITLSDVEALRERLRNERPTLTRQQIAEMQKVKLQTVTKWVKNGLLSPVDVTGKGMYLDKAEVEAFFAAHVFTEEAAKILGIGVLAVQKWARTGRLKPVSGGDADGLHRYLFRREDVERLHPENRLIGPQLARRLGISRAQLWQRIRQGKVTPVSGPGIDGSGQFLFVSSDVI